MSRRSADDVFDTHRFHRDVVAHMDRWQLSRRGMARAAGLDLSTVSLFLRGELAPSLLVACSLADVCDLSLDSYRQSVLEDVS